MTDVPSGFALRFISGKYQGGEYPLPSEKEIVIGRGGELDIVLVEDMVSRKHAKITTQQGKIVIQDLGSTNGTFVNGEKIKRAKLKEGDRVLIGTSILKLISAADAHAAVQGTREEQNQQLENLSRSRPKVDVTNGRIEDLPLADVLTFISSNKKSGVLTVQGDSDNGRVYFKGGRIFYAVLNDNEELGPIKALYRMVSLPSGSYELGAATDEEFVLELETPTDQLVADALREANELKAMQSELPEVEDMIVLPRPLKPPLSKLSPDELELIQLAMNEGFFQSILDKSPFTDLKTAQLIKGLMEREYLRT
ncbi:MAG: FHA domain-containing protein [Deltaproteobacteria bacterium]|nr:FHA domain-containing protein [Deltaproteobacteria bacterium]